MLSCCGAGVRCWHEAAVRKCSLYPNDFSKLATLKSEIIRFQQRYEKSAKPFEWTFTRRDLHDLLAKLNSKSDRLAA